MPPYRITGRWRRWAARLKVETMALYCAYRDPRVPWYAKVVAACVVAYALSPIDLVPDFVPVVGYLDDLLLVPLGIALAIRLIPAHVLDECRDRAREAANRPARGLPTAAAVSIVLTWVVLLAAAALLVYRFVR